MANLNVHDICARIGIARIADITGYDVLGVPVAAAIHPRVTAWQITAHQGKDLTLHGAMLKSVMEAVERHAASHATGDRFTSADQFEAAQTLSRPASLSEEIWWSQGSSYSTGQPCWAPTDRVRFPIPHWSGDWPRPSTTGLAAHADLTSALEHGILEVVERDALRRYMLDGSARVIELGDVDDTQCLTIMHAMQRAGIEMQALLLPHPVPVCPVLVLTRERGGLCTPLLIAGQAARLTPEEALKAALLEVAQSRCVALQASREDLDRHQVGWQGDETEEVWMSDSSKPLLGWAELRQMFFPKRSLRERLRADASGNDFYWFDLSRHAHGIPVVRVISPNLCDASQAFLS